MRRLLILLFLLTGQLCYANMASPIRQGTYSSAAFSSRDIDILKETIHLAIDKDFKTAHYAIEYFINADSAGRQIPLLFHAIDYKGDFKIWVDNQPVTLLAIPGEYKVTQGTPFEKFSKAFQPASAPGESERVVIYWENHSGIVYELNDLKYFEADLSKGAHVIRVEYTANAWTDISDWVKEYSFRYSLSPAKNWKSFGTLEIILDATASAAMLSTNLGAPSSGRLDSLAAWNFSTLPANYFEISYTPAISGYAKTMISTGPTGLTLIMALALVLLHLFGIRWYRHNAPAARYSWVVIAGSVIIPLLVLIGYMMSFAIIDDAIGPEAGKYHGYTFLVLILYPVLMPVYWLVMWFIDRTLKRRISNTLQGISKNH